MRPTSDNINLIDQRLAILPLSGLHGGRKDVVSEFMKGVDTPTNFSFGRIDLSTGDLTSASVTHTDQKEHDWNL